MNRLLAGICMVTGTTIGGGMVILPVVMGVYGYASAIILLTIIWLINTTIALVFLEANCYLPTKTNFISLSRQFLKNRGANLCWFISLLFLYSIMCVYITGVSEIVRGAFNSISFEVPSYGIASVAILAIGFPLYQGIKNISFINQIIVTAMIIFFLVLTLLLLPNIQLDYIITSKNTIPIMALPIGFTSFGFLVIIPSLRELLDDNIKHLKLAIIVGSVVPLILYILWITVIMGIIPDNGQASLQAILENSESVKLMSETLHRQSGFNLLAWCIQFFMLLAITSSFIGTSLGLHDFLADGLKTVQKKQSKLIVLSLTFLPPLCIALLLPRLYIIGLGFAGLVSTVLFGVYPVLLTWSARYKSQLTTKYHAPLNKFWLGMLILFALLIISVELYSLWLDFFLRGE